MIATVWLLWVLLSDSAPVRGIRRWYKLGRKMSDPRSSSADTVLRWIADEQHVHRTREYGNNEHSVRDALSAQRQRVHVVRDYQRDVDKVAKAEKDDKEKKHIKSAYDGLKAVSEKRLHCLEDISQISGIEDLLGKLSVEFANKTTSLVKREVERATNIPDKDGEGVAAAAQNCVLAVRENWDWISTLVRCAEIHLKHASYYHQFYHEAKEWEHWMPIELRQATDKVCMSQESVDDGQEASRLLLELKELLTMFLHWQGKVDSLFERSRHVIPVHLRTKKLDYFRPVSSLCNYKTREINVREGEELTLLDNSQHENWKVRTLNSVTSKVPSVICVIPGPDPNAIDTANRLRFQLLGVWTLNLKRIGKTLIYFIVLLLHDWSEDEIKKLKAIPAAQKQEIRRMLDYIEEILLPHWKDYEGYTELHRRIEILRHILSQNGDPKDKDDAFSGALMLELGLVRELLMKYKDFWNFWETFKILIDNSRNPEYLLIADKWEQLKFLDVSELRKLWHSGLGLGQEEFSDFEEWMEFVRTMWEKRYGRHSVIEEEMVKAEGLGELEAMPEGDEADSAMTMQRTLETATTDEMMQAEREEKRSFVISGVIDPRTKQEISMQEAVKIGVINSTDGTYNNPLTGQSMPIPTAMSEGYIKVEFTTTRTSKEKRRDVGLITIKTQKESRPYTLNAVVDAKTDRHLSIDEATKAGILDQTSGEYYNSLTDAKMSLADALDSGLLIVDFDNKVEVAEPEIVTKTYAIHAVVDQRTRNKVTFVQAVRSGLLDRETGAYFHHGNNEYVYVGEAIKRGFIKASIVKDPNALDIDPENKMIIDKVEQIRKKLVTPMKIVAAFKAASAAQENGGK